MKRNFLLILYAVTTCLGLQAQVTQINSNKSLQSQYPLSNSKAIYVSNIDQTIWGTDGTLAGTIQLSPDIKFVEAMGSLSFLDGKLIFAGSTTATGTEVYITDGTPGGTILVKDINPGVTGSAANYLTTLNGYIYFSAETPAVGNELWRTNGTPGGTTLVKDINTGAAGSSIVAGDLATLSGILYFTAETAAEGLELWRTDGSTVGTTLVKDIVTGVAGSNYPGKYELLATSTYLLFMARTPASGVELWRSDGTNGGTVLLKDINAGADSSNARSFFILNSLVLFAANNTTNGDEIWRTDGTAAGTTLLKDINPGTASSTGIELFPGFNNPIFGGFHTFNNRAYFNAYDGTSTGEVWGTDGTTPNTLLLKDIVTGTSLSLILVTSAINLPTKFIFPVSDLAGRSELWQSDGTPGGTVLLKAFTPNAAAGFPFILLNFTFSNSQLLFQGDKFFFTVGTAAEGDELWISDGVDGTVTHTRIVKDINPGTGSSNPINGLYIFTSTALFFSADNGTNGRELWRTDGTLAGTNMVADIVTGTGGSNPTIDFFIVNGKILFQANNGDDPVLTDLYAVDGTFFPLPVSLDDFTVTLKSGDGLLAWHTLQELNSKNFTVQRSFDGQVFENIGTVAALGSSTTRHAYTFIDAAIANRGKSVVYYRLLATDIDGKSTLSPVITLKLKGSYQWTVGLLNNPIRENMKVVLSGITQNVQLTIIDMSGKKMITILRPAVNGQVSVPVPNLPHGLYTLLTETNNERKTIQFVK